MRKLKSLVVSTLTTTLLTIMLTACGGSTVQVVVTATPSPTAVSDVITSPVGSSAVANGDLSIDHPTPGTASDNELSLGQPTQDATRVPGSSPTIKPLPPELTDGVQALVRCAGETEVYWLEHGPPRMTSELVQCLNDGLIGE